MDLLRASTSWVYKTAIEDVLSTLSDPPGRPIDQFCFLPPIIARSVFSQEDLLARRARRREGSSMSLQPPFSPSSGPTAAGRDPPPVAATGASGLTRS